jgi:integrase
MSRRRTGIVVDLPREVHVVRNAKSGKTYYYWAPERGTGRAGERTSLPSDPSSKEFWARIDELRGGHTAPLGSVAALVQGYRASQEFNATAPSTQNSYEVSLRRFESKDTWGLFQAKDLSPMAVVAARDALSATPYMANQMLAVGRALWDWGIPLGILGRVAVNPFEKVKDLPTPDRGHIPWPVWAQEAVIAGAPTDIVRFVTLGLMTGQRESDLIRFGPDHRERTGLWCRPQKTNRVRRAFYIPISTTDALELDRWAKTPIVFDNPRWKAPIAKHNPDLYIYTPRGNAYTTMAIRSRWHRWLVTTEGKALCDQWRAWLTIQVKRYGWDIEPEEVKGPTLHGLRGATVVSRRQQGYEAQSISNDIGMSIQMVMHYTRFMDQMEAAEANRRRFEVIR